MSDSVMSPSAEWVRRPPANTPRAKRAVNSVQWRIAMSNVFRDQQVLRTVPTEGSREEEEAPTV
ncbi:unnamed protein product [Clonostachys rosea]|uniref:Uncharacterized protein n=1 Tax=Bionectria ochroleuca TaxID=29856 RepID=A0ABY6UJN4_BIOOC|nr:unnamed protein product [Clonostachys rosea]